MFREEGHYRMQRQYLPTRGDIPITTQFGFIPKSILKPEKKSKENWKNAFLNDDVIDVRKKGFYAKDNIMKMSEFTNLPKSSQRSPVSIHSPRIKYGVFEYVGSS